MKVRVEMTVDIDPRVWDPQFGGTHDDAWYVRREVRQFVRSNVTQGLSDRGVLIAITKGAAA